MPSWRTAGTRLSLRRQHSPGPGAAGACAGLCSAFRRCDADNGVAVWRVVCGGGEGGGSVLYGGGWWGLAHGWVCLRARLHGGEGDPFSSSHDTVHRDQEASWHLGRRSHSRRGQRAQWAFVPRGQRGRPDVGFSVTEGHVSGAPSRHLPGPSPSAGAQTAGVLPLSCCRVSAASDMHLPVSAFPGYCRAREELAASVSEPQTGHLAGSASICGLFVSNLQTYPRAF